jgi:hypothetical protein
MSKRTHDGTFKASGRRSAGIDDPAAVNEAVIRAGMLPTRKPPAGCSWSTFSSAPAPHWPDNVGGHRGGGAVKKLMLQSNAGNVKKALHFVVVWVLGECIVKTAACLCLEYTHCTVLLTAPR